MGAGPQDPNPVPRPKDRPGTAGHKSGSTEQWKARGNENWGKQKPKRGSVNPHKGSNTMDAQGTIRSTSPT